MSYATRLLVPFGLVLLVASTASAQYMPAPRDPSRLQEIRPSGRKHPLEFRGNLLVDDGRIRAGANLSTAAEIDPDSAAKAARAVEDFYHGAGFPLARASAAQEPEGWTILIDEGVLYSISIYGAGWRDTFLLRETLLPFEVLHVPTLEQGLSRWLQERPGYRIRYELSERPVTKEKAVKAPNPLNRFLTSSEDLAKLREESHTSLLVYIERAEERAGVDVGIGYSSANKLEFRLNYDKGSMLMEKDRTEIGLMAGIARRSTIDPNADGSQYYSNAALNARWFSPPFGTSWLKFSPAAGVSNFNEQRPDLPLDRYRTLETFGDLGLAGEWKKHRYTFLSAGYGLKHIFGVDTIPSDPYNVAEATVEGFRLRTGVNMLLSPPRENRLLNDSLKVELLWHRRGGDGQILQATADYQKVFFTSAAFYLLQARGIWQGGEVQFYDELQLTRLGMSASFGREFWVRRAANFGGEARFNVWGSAIQAGFFANAAPFGYVDRTTNQQSLQAAFDVGPVAYCTLFDAFQLSLGFATGFATVGDRSYDFKIGFDKIF